MLVFDQGLAARRAGSIDAPIAIMPQTVDPMIAEALDLIPQEQLPQMICEGPPPAIAKQLQTGLLQAAIGPDWLAAWLLQNISFQVKLFGQLTQSPALRLRLEVVTDDGCPRFHTDSVRYRLLCTFRGPGTEWLDPKAVWSQQSGRPVDGASVRQLERGAIAFIRGSLGATPDRPALLHRSPAIEGKGIARLLLVIDSAD